MLRIHSEIRCWRIRAKTVAKSDKCEDDVILHKHKKLDKNNRSFWKRLPENRIIRQKQLGRMTHVRV